MNTERVWELLLLKDEDELSSTEQAELRRLLASDASARRKLVEYYLIASGAASHLRAASTTVIERPKSWWARLRLPLAAAAAVILAAAGVWIWSAELRMRSSERVARVTEKVSGVRFRVSGGSWSDLSVGDEVRDGTRIETGEGGRVKLAFGAKGTDIVAGEHSTLNIQRSTRDGENIIHLEQGKLTASVAKRKPGAPFVVMTPHARIEVKGTRFTLGVDAKATRLEVLEGLVGMTRVSDGKSIDVAAGQYAVAAEGVELVALAIPPDMGAKAWEQAEICTGPLTQLYGKVLFEDEFDRGLDNWEVVVGDEKGEFEKAATDPDRYVKLERNYPHKPKYSQKVTPVETCAWIWGERGEDRLVGIRLKKPIEADRFVVIMRCGLIPPSTPGHKGGGVYSPGIEARTGDVVEVVYDRDLKGGAGRWNQALEYHAWEFTSEGGAGPEPVYFCRELVNDTNAKPGVEGVRLMVARRVRPVSKRLVFSVSQWNMIVDSVEVRELLEDDVAEGRTQ